MNLARVGVIHLGAYNLFSLYIPIPFAVGDVSIIQQEAERPRSDWNRE